MTRRRQSLDGPWRYAPQAHQVLKPGGVIEESTDNLPPGGEMQIPCNWPAACSLMHPPRRSHLRPPAITRCVWPCFVTASNSQATAMR